MLIASVYIGFAVADGRQKVIVAESTVVVAAVAVTGPVRGDGIGLASAARFSSSRRLASQPAAPSLMSREPRRQLVGAGIAELLVLGVRLGSELLPFRK